MYVHFIYIVHKYVAIETYLFTHIYIYIYTVHKINIKLLNYNICNMFRALTTCMLTLTTNSKIALSSSTPCTSTVHCCLMALKDGCGVLAADGSVSTEIDTRSL